MRHNTMKEKLQKGELVTGCMLQGYLPSLVEICGLAGFDFVFLDAEHGPLSPEDCEGLARAAEVRGVTPLVRVPDLQESTLLRYLDVGAMGVILPGVSSVQEAREAVAAVKYHPLGKRGLNGVRASGYGMERPLADYAQEANRETVVLAIIENTAAMEALPEILQVEGQLATSITTQYDNESALIGSNLAYAAIHQLGGQADKGKKVTIPARSYLRLSEKEIIGVNQTTLKFLC